MAEQEVKAIFTADTSGITSGARQAINSMQSVKDSSSSLSSAISTATSAIGKTMIGVGAATTAMGVKAVKGFGDFEASLNKAAVIAGGTSKDIGGLADMANRLGAELPLSAKDAADAMVAMARDGASISTIKKEFPAIAQAATAAGADLQTTASVVQQSMNIWGKALASPQQAAAILTQTANLSNASIEDMQQALATIGGTAQNAGVDMQTTSIALGLLTNRGFSAAQASQDLNHALLLMQAPSKKGAEQMHDLGLTMTDAQGNMKPLPTILNEIGDSMANMTSSEKAKALKTMFGSAGMAAVLPLLDSVKDKTDNTTTSWSAFANQMQTATADTKTATSFLREQANEMQKNLGSKIEQVGGNWESLSNKAMAGSAGVTGAFLDMTNNALTWAGDSNAAFAQVIRQFIGLSPAIGSATLAIGGFLTNATKIISTVKSFGQIMIAGFTTPIGLAILAIAGLVAALVMFYQRSETFREAVGNVGKAIQTAFGPAIKFASATIQVFIKETTSQFNSLVSELSAIFSGMGNSINLDGLGSKMISIFSQIMNVITIVRNGVVDFITAFAQTGAIQAAWTAIQAVIGAVGTIINTAIAIVGNLFGSISAGGGNANTTFQNLGTFVGNVVTALANGITAVSNFINSFLKIEAVRDALTAVAAGVGVTFALFKIGGAVVSGFTAVMNIAKLAVLAFNIALNANPISLIITAIVALVAGLVYFFSQTKTGQAIWAAFVQALIIQWNIIKAYVQFVCDLIIGAWNGAATGATNAWNGFSAFFVGLWNGLVGIVTGVVNGIVSAWNGAVAMIQAAWAGVGTFFAGLWNGIVAAAQVVINVLMVAWQNLNANLGGVWTGLVAIASGIWNLLKDVIMGPILLLLDLVIGNFTQLGIDAQNIWNNIVASLSAIWNGIVMIVSTVFNFAAATINQAWQTVSDFAVSIWNTVVGFLSGIWNSIVSSATSFANSVWKTIVNVWNAIPGWASGLWNSVLGTISSVWNSIISSAVNFGRSVWNAIVNVWNSIPGWASGLWNSVLSTIRGVWNGIIGSVSGAANAVFGAIQGAWGGVVGWVSGIWNGVRGAIQAAMNFDLGAAGRAIMDSFLGGLRAAWGAVQNFVGGIANWIRDHKGPISYDRRLLIPAGKAIMGGFNESLQDSFKDVKQTVQGVAPFIQDALDGSGDFNVNTSLSNGLDVNNGSLSVDMAKTQRPMNVNLSMGQDTYNAYVDNISDRQGQAATLKRTNSVYL